MNVMKIDITSDLICPFCLLGVKQMTNAIDTYKSTHPDAPDFAIRLLPYRLRQDFTETPEDRRMMYVKKFGSLEKAKAMEYMMHQKFGALGYKPDFSGTISSSHLVHRLQTYSLLKDPDHQLPLAMELLEGFHCHRKDPSDKSWLSSVAVKHGLFADENAAVAWLNGDECDVEVKQAYLLAQKMGITGVPFFVFQDKYAASGAMGEEEFVKLLEEIIKRETAAADKPVAPPTFVTDRTSVCS
ncbi:hypothetical protein IAU60_005339 [Kwoniella sp. DSM 27419]